MQIANFINFYTNDIILNYNKSDGGGSKSDILNYAIHEKVLGRNRQNACLMDTLFPKLLAFLEKKHFNYF